MNNDRWSETEKIFHAALEQPADERAVFLDSRCGNDAELREAVESLLAHTGKTGELDALVGEAAVSLTQQDQQRAGMQIGPYKILDIIGEGGMGTVYLAERADDQFEKRVAIKLIRRGAASAELMKRFRVERQILANLEHPNIARLLDGGTTESGSPFLVMEYVDGQPIDEYCEQHKLPVRERLQLFRKVCSAAQYAHQNLIVHRDLKPTNLLVTEDGEPQLLDFGIAKLLDNSQPDNTVVETGAEQRLLTPQYSSPEQLSGEPVSTVTDVYALGVILYELITGTGPYGKLGNNPYTVGQVIINTEPVKPSAAVLRPGLDSMGDGGVSTGLQPAQLSRRLAGDLDDIVMMAIRKEPERRYYSVAQFSEDIENHLAQRPVLARRNSLSYRAGKFVLRNRYSSSLAALLLVSIVGFGFAIVQQSSQVARERDLAQQQRGRAEAISGFLTGMFAELDPESALGKEITVREVLDKAGAQLEQNGQTSMLSEPLVEATVRRVIGRTYVDLGMLSPAEQHLERALALHREGRVGDAEEFLAALMARSGLYHLQFQEDDLLAMTEEALVLSTKLYGEEDQHTLETLINVASAHKMKGDLLTAERMSAEVLEKRRRVLGENHPDTLTSINEMGVINHWMGRFAEAERYYRLSLSRAREHLGENHPDTLRFLLNLGAMLETVGRFADAEPIIKEHIDRSALVMGAGHPSTLRSMHNLADTYRGLGRVEQSEALFLDTLSKRRQFLGADHIETLQTQMKLARLLRQLGRYDEAAPLVEDTVDKQTGKLGFEHPTTLIAAQELADLYRERQSLDKALSLSESILSAREKVLGENHPELSNTLSGLAQIHLALDNPGDAESYLLRALQLADDTPDFKNHDVSGLLGMLVTFYRDAGQAERAAPYIVRLSTVQ